MNLGGPLSLNFSRGGLEVMFLVVSIGMLQSWMQIRPIVLVDFVTSEYLNFNPFFAFLKAKCFYSKKKFAFYSVWDFNGKLRFVIWIYGSEFASNFLGEALFYCNGLNVFYFLDSSSIWNVKGMKQGSILKTLLLLLGLEEIFIFLLCYQLAFFNDCLLLFHFTVFTPCDVLFSTVCTPRFIRTFIS